MKKELLKSQAYLTGIRSLKDGSVQYTFETQEVGPDEGSAAFALRNAFGWLLFAERELRSDDIPEGVSAQGAKRKSPSQRLRNVLFRVFENTASELTFDRWYEVEMEKLIDHYKKKLD